MRYKWGIDLGGTKIEGVILDADHHLQTVARIRVPTEAHKGYRHIISQLVTLLELLKKESGLHPERIGMGTPGAFDFKQRKMKNCNTTCLIGEDLPGDLEKELGIPVLISNDANCFAVAEAKMGAVADLATSPKVVFGIIMGSGVGGGVVVNGQIINGKHSIGGEWGHNQLVEDGPECYCGKKGCVEKIIAGPSLEKYYHYISGEELKLKDIVERYRAGSDPFATKTIERLIHFFGKAVSVLINILDPDVIVIGGGVGNVDELYTLGVEAAKKHVFNGEINTIFLKPKLGDSAGVFGAALL